MRIFAVYVVILLILPTISMFGMEESISIRSGSNVRINISFSLEDSLAFSDQLLTIKSNDAVYCAFTIEKTDTGVLYINYLTHNSFNRCVIGFKSDTCDIIFDFNQANKTCTLSTESDTIVIPDINIPISNITFTSLPLLDIDYIYNFEIKEEPLANNEFIELKWALLFILFDLVIFLVIYIRNRVKNKEESAGNIVIKHKHYLKQNRIVNSSISLFGKFKIVNKYGEDITGKFSPILREILFLLICHTRNNGISSERMKDFLWLDKSHKSATNNRSVYFSKLRSLMKEVGEFNLISDKGVWRIETFHIEIDYLSFLEIIDKTTVTKTDIISLLCILESGKFLAEFESQWADAFKSNVSDSVISVLSNYLLEFNIKEEPDFAIQICDVIFNFDSLNEIALNFKCKAYKEKGNHTLAKLTYSNYSKEYLALYGEEYSKSFSDIFYLQHL